MDRRQPPGGASTIVLGTMDDAAARGVRGGNESNYAPAPPPPQMVPSPRRIPSPRQQQQHQQQQQPGYTTSSHDIGAGGGGGGGSGSGGGVSGGSRPIAANFTHTMAPMALVPQPPPPQHHAPPPMMSHYQPSPMPVPMPLGGAYGGAPRSHPLRFSEQFNSSPSLAGDVSGEAMVSKVQLQTLRADLVRVMSALDNSRDDAQARLHEHDVLHAQHRHDYRLLQTEMNRQADEIRAQLLARDKGLRHLESQAQVNAAMNSPTREQNNYEVMEAQRQIQAVQHRLSVEEDEKRRMKSDFQRSLEELRQQMTQREAKLQEMFESKMANVVQMLQNTDADRNAAQRAREREEQMMRQDQSQFHRVHEKISQIERTLQEESVRRAEADNEIKNYVQQSSVDRVRMLESESQKTEKLFSNDLIRVSEEMKSSIQHLKHELGEKEELLRTEIMTRMQQENNMEQLLSNTEEAVTSGMSALSKKIRDVSLKCFEEIGQIKARINTESRAKLEQVDRSLEIVQSELRRLDKSDTSRRDTMQQLQADVGEVSKHVCPRLQAQMDQLGGSLKSFKNTLEEIEANVSAANRNSKLDMSKALEDMKNETLKERTERLKATDDINSELRAVDRIVKELQKSAEIRSREVMDSLEEKTRKVEANMHNMKLNTAMELADGGQTRQLKRQLQDYEDELQAALMRIDRMERDIQNKTKETKREKKKKDAAGEDGEEGENLFGPTLTPKVVDAKIEAMQHEFDRKFSKQKTALEGFLARIADLSDELESVKKEREGFKHLALEVASVQSSLEMIKIQYRVGGGSPSRSRKGYHDEIPNKDGDTSSLTKAVVKEITQGHYLDEYQQQLRAKGNIDLETKVATMRDELDGVVSKVMSLTMETISSGNTPIQGGGGGGGGQAASFGPSQAAWDEVMHKVSHLERMLDNDGEAGGQLMNHDAIVKRQQQETVKLLRLEDAMDSLKTKVDSLAANGVAATPTNPRKLTAMSSATDMSATAGEQDDGAHSTDKSKYAERSKLEKVAKTLARQLKDLQDKVETLSGAQRQMVVASVGGGVTGQAESAVGVLMSQMDRVELRLSKLEPEPDVLKQQLSLIQAETKANKEKIAAIELSKAGRSAVDLLAQSDAGGAGLSAGMEDLLVKVDSKLDELSGKVEKHEEHVLKQQSTLEKLASSGGIDMNATSDTGGGDDGAASAKVTKLNEKMEKALKALASKIKDVGGRVAVIEEWKEAEKNRVRDERPADDSASLGSDPLKPGTAGTQRSDTLSAISTGSNTQDLKEKVSKLELAVKTVANKAKDFKDQLEILVQRVDNLALISSGQAGVAADGAGAGVGGGEGNVAELEGKVKKWLKASVTHLNARIDEVTKDVQELWSHAEMPDKKKPFAGGPSKSPVF